MILHRRLLLTLALLLPVSQGRAVDLGFSPDDGGAPGSFLNFGASARSLGMGGAYVGQSDDASAVYWNPAGLTQLTQQDVVAVYSSLEEHTRFGSASYAYPLGGAGVLGASVVTLQSDGFRKTNSNAEILGEFDASQTGVLLAYAWGSDRLSLGATTKYIHQSVDVHSGSAFGLDLGGRMRFSPRWQIGAALHNIVPPQMTLARHKERYDVDGRLGVAFQPTSRWTFTLDGMKGENTSFRPFLGSEWKVAEIVALRAGINQREWTAGLGVGLGNWNLDYSFGYQDAAAGIKDLGSSHRLGLHFRFGSYESSASEARGLAPSAEVLMTALDQALDAGPNAKVPTNLQDRVASHYFDRMEDALTVQGMALAVNGQVAAGVEKLAVAVALNPASERQKNYLRKVISKMSAEEKEKFVAEKKQEARAALGTDRRASDAIVASAAGLAVRPDDTELRQTLQQGREKVAPQVATRAKHAETLFDQGHVEAALDEVQAALKLDPFDTSARHVALMAVDQSNQQVRLKRAIRETRVQKQKSKDLYRFALELEENANYEDACTVLKRAIALDENNMDARKALDRLTKQMNLGPRADATETTPIAPQP